MSDAQLTCVLFAFPFLALAAVFFVAHLAEACRENDAKAAPVRAQRRGR